ncbi:MAG: ferritin-like domain-containing protein [Gemmatimonadota bacterium]|jgi:rubrerythrin|nr:ferritin-like domain-containing protein [Gemmatimonadota bacterium]
MESTNRSRGGAPASAEVVDTLNDLLQLDHDAIGAYEIAIEKLSDRSLADRIQEFKHDHQRHIAELNDALAALGGTPKNEPHATGPFKQGLQSLGGLAGNKGVLMAWRTNEMQAKTKYSKAASDAVGWPEGARTVVERNARDEERHYRWVMDALEGMGAGDGPGRVEQVKEGTREAVEGARDRVAGGLEAVASRLGQMAEGGGRGSGVADRVAGGLGSAAHGVRDGELAGGIESQVRSNPARTLLTAAVAGFVLGRILR